MNSFAFQVQFSAAGVLGMRALVVGCNFPLWMQYALVVYMFSFIVLFSRFYRSSYNKSVRKKIDGVSIFGWSRQRLMRWWFLASPNGFFWRSFAHNKRRFGLVPLAMPTSQPDQNLALLFSRIPSM